MSDATAGPDGPIKIVICDDAEAATESDWQRLHACAAGDDGRAFERLGRAVSATEAITEGRRRVADAILIDLVMPKREYGRRVMAGPWVARALSRFYAKTDGPFRRDDDASSLKPRAPRLVLWTSNPLQTVRCEVHAFMTLGGQNVVDKQAPTNKQVESIRRIVMHDEVWEPEDEDHLPKALRETLAFLEAGYSNQQMADELILSIGAIEDRVGRLRSALGVPAGTGKGAGPVLQAARATGVGWTPLRYLDEPPESDPLALAH